MDKAFSKGVIQSSQAKKKMVSGEHVDGEMMKAVNGSMVESLAGRKPRERKASACWCDFVMRDWHRV